MSSWLMGAGIVIYLGTAIDQFLKGQKALAGMWACYAIANLCMMFVNK